VPAGDLTVDAYVDRVGTRLTRERFVVQSVEGSARNAEFSYSVGLTAHGLPELIVLGVRPADAHPLIPLWADYVLDESLVLPGETLRCGRFVMEVVEVARPAEHLALAAVLYGESVRALQLACADDAGVWP
jgi:hypothetical protein